MAGCGLVSLMSLILVGTDRADPNLEMPVATIPLTGNEGHRLYALAYSPDGQILAIGGTGRAVILVDRATRKIERQWSAHPDAVWTIAWSKDGKQLFTGGRGDPVLRVWDRSTGRELESFVGHRGGITSIRVFDSGTKLIMAGGSWDPSLRVWSIPDRRLLLSMTGHADLIDAMDVTHNGRWAITGSRDGSLRLWDVQRGSEVWSHRVETQGGSAGYLSVAFSPDGRLFAAGLEDGGLIVRETLTRRRCLPAKERGGETRALAFSPDGTQLAFADASRRIHIMNVRTGRTETTFEGPRADIFSVAFSPDSRELASVGADATVYIWRVPQINIPKKKLSDDERLRAIDLLSSDNPSSARHAINDLILDVGPTSSELIAARLRPTPKDQEVSIRRWIEQLASPRFIEREQAIEELSRLADQFEISLRQVWSTTNNAEQRRRLDRILNYQSRSVPSGDRLAQRRMIAVLEARADPPALECLRRVAAGGPSALTLDATEALSRIQQATTAKADPDPPRKRD
jgi:WD40 repeat protein